MRDISETIAALSLEEKVALTDGADFWTTRALPEHDVRSVRMADGPHGLRRQTGESDMIGINASIPATCFPTAVTSGASWSEELLSAEGAAIAREAKAAGVDVVLGPGCNIKRNPLCGRNFEYFSEDPLVAGKMAAAEIRGLQGEGVAASLKHFAVNSQEYKRMNGDSRVSDRALREVYLAPFETAVKEAHPKTVMCSYNKINGVHASDNRWLLTEVLRDEWGFDGLVVTDWGAMNDRVAGVAAGCDLNMPGGSAYMRKDVLTAVREGRLDEAALDACVARVLKLASKSAARADEAVDEEAHHQLARRIAEAGAVLLQNDGVLPAAEQDLVLIGSMAGEHWRYQGAGSSHINPTRLETLVDALPDVPHVACGDKDGRVTDEEIAAAVEAAEAARVAVVVAGLPESFESEGFDRETMEMPEGYNRLISAVAAANPRTVVVLLGGAPFLLPWADEVAAVLYMGLSGQAGGAACARLLTGAANPGGKLTETWPLAFEDVSSAETFGRKVVEYDEGVFVGYRHFDRGDKPVRFPFGHGLSYTQFTYSDLRFCEEDLTAEVTITNVGSLAGAEVAQLYVGAPGGDRPVKELRGFARVELAPGESATARFQLTERDFALWDNGWFIPGGDYQLMAGASSRDIRLSATVYRAEQRLSSAEPSPVVAVAPEATKGSYTMDNSVLEMARGSLVMRAMYKIIRLVIGRTASEGERKMMVVSATDCPLRSMVLCSGGAMREWMAHLLLKLANRI